MELKTVQPPDSKDLFAVRRQIKHRDIAALHEFVERRHIGRHDLLPGGELLIKLAPKKLKHFVLLLRWSAISGLYNAAEAIQLFIEHVGECQISLRALHVDLDQLLFERDHLLIER